MTAIKDESVAAPGAADVLLVEDNQDEAELLLRAFKKRQIPNPIHHVQDGRAALDFLYGRGPYSDRAGKPPPCLVILDMKVPFLSGMEVLKAMRHTETLSAVPVVALTSSQLPSDIKTCYELGVNSYLVKPIEYDHFLEVVGKMGMYWLLLNKTCESDLALGSGSC